MSKYDKLWEYVEKQEGDELVLTFDEIGTIAGVPLDHSFLNYKKELVPHGWEVGKISMKQQTVRFKIDGKGGRRLAKRTFAGAYNSRSRAQIALFVDEGRPFCA